VTIAAASALTPARLLGGTNLVLGLRSPPASSPPARPLVRAFLRRGAFLRCGSEVSLVGVLDVRIAPAAFRPSPGRLQLVVIRLASAGLCFRSLGFGRRAPWAPGPAPPAAPGAFFAVRLRSLGCGFRRRWSRRGLGPFGLRFGGGGGIFFGGLLASAAAAGRGLPVRCRHLGLARRSRIWGLDGGVVVEDVRPEVADRVCHGNSAGPERGNLVEIAR